MKHACAGIMIACFSISTALSSAADQRTPGAVETLASHSRRSTSASNNASRGPAEVATARAPHGFHGRSRRNIVTSAQSAARLLQGTAAARRGGLLIVGTDSLAAEVRCLLLTTCCSGRMGPVAVVQGHSPQTGWPDLAEARPSAAAHWLAANVDRSLPSERGLVNPERRTGCALCAATHRCTQVAGKPSDPPFFDRCVGAGHVPTLLVVGDRPRHRHRRRQHCRPAELAGRVCGVDMATPYGRPVGRRLSYRRDPSAVVRRAAQPSCWAPPPAWGTSTSAPRR